MRALLLLLVAALTLALGGSAQAHTRSESDSLWEVGGQTVHLMIGFSETEVKPLYKSGRPPSDAQLQAYLAEREYPVADGRRCPLDPPVETLSAVMGFRKFDLTFTCGAYRRLQLHSAAFQDLTPSHTNFAQIQDSRSGEFTEQLITRDRPTVEVTGADGELAEAGFGQFVLMGVMHIFTGVDHMAFLVGLVLISRRLKDLVFVVTGFTIGHSLTLALAVTGVLRPHPEFIDALVALTIGLIGAENVAVATRRPLAVASVTGAALVAMLALRLAGVGQLPVLLLLGSALFAASYLMASGSLPNAGRLRMVITVVFGLIHGFGFAANLLEMQLPTGRLAELLVGFNLGVEIGQLTLVLGVSGLAWLLMRARLAAPRPIVTELASGVLVMLGAYWFVLRSL